MNALCGCAAGGEVSKEAEEEEKGRRRRGRRGRTWTALRIEDDMALRVGRLERVYGGAGGGKRPASEAA